LNKFLISVFAVSAIAFGAFHNDTNAGFWDWFNLNKNKVNNDSQQAAAVANADTTSSSSSVSLTAKTGNALDITSSSASLNGTINPKGENVSVYFKYRKESESAEATKTTEWMSTGSRSNDFAAIVKISGLSFGTKYVYRFYAYNYTSGKTIYGDLKYFTTKTSSESSSSVQSSSSSVSSGASSSSSSVQQYTLKVKISGAGKITSSGGSGVINCKRTVDSKGKTEIGGDCSVKFNKGESVILTPSTPSTQYEFATWADDCRAAQKVTSCTIKMSGNKTVSATFNKKGSANKETVSVSVRKTGKGVGKVVSINSSGKEISGINCGSNCSENYEQICEITAGGRGTGTGCSLAYFRAVAEKGSTFSGWGGGCLTFKNVKDQCYVTLDGDKTINASFSEGIDNKEGKYYDLTVTVSEGGNVASTDGKINCSSGNSPCAHSYGKNGTVTLKITPDSGYALGEYSGCSKSGNVQNNILTCKTKMTQNRNVNVSFKASGTSSSSSSSKASSSSTGSYSTVTGSASKITSTSATLNGTITPNGNSLSYIFAYRKNSESSSATKYVPSNTYTSIGSTSGDVSVSADISGLSSGTKYIYRLYVWNSKTEKVTSGLVKYFTTSSSESSSSSSSSSVSSGSAGSVDLKVREVKENDQYGDYSDSITLNNANSRGTESAELKWTVSNVKNCSLSYGSNAKELSNTPDSTNIIANSGKAYRTPDYTVNTSSRQTATYTLNCADTNGNSLSDSASVTY